MKILRQVDRAFRRSALIRNIEVAKSRLVKASDAEKIRYELELMAFRQQIRLLDSHADIRVPR